MRRVLHILTTKPDVLQESIRRIQSQDLNIQVRTVDLTQPDADYHRLLEEIFASESIQVW